MMSAGWTDLVEADIFDCRSDDGAACGWAGCTRDDINVGCADDEVQWKRGRQGDGEHLTLPWR